MTMPDPAVLARATWRKSSYSGGGNQCVEVAAAAGIYAVRDSKNPAAAYLAFTGEAWKAFLAQMKQGEAPALSGAQRRAKRRGPAR